MSQHLDSLELGDTIDIRGPEGKVTYLGRGELLVVSCVILCNKYLLTFVKCCNCLIGYASMLCVFCSCVEYYTLSDVFFC